MRIGSIIVIIWLIIGAVAAGQRDYFSNDVDNCSQVGTIVVTIIAGPLNYVGLNPKLACEAPQPSK